MVYTVVALTSAFAPGVGPWMSCKASQEPTGD